jgi:cytochrome b561
MNRAAAGSALSRYSRGAIVFHWTIAILIIGNIAGALISDDWEGPARAAIMGLHKATGITILVLSLARLAWRLAHKPPPLPAGIRPWERAAAGTVYVIFYALMIILPLTGWLMISASETRRPFSWYWLFDLPYLPVRGDKALGGFAHEAHEVLGYTMIALLLLHISAAIKHHFIDNTRLISRMLPGKTAAR